MRVATNNLTVADQDLKGQVRPVRASIGEDLHPQPYRACVRKQHELQFLSCPIHRRHQAVL